MSTHWPELQVPWSTLREKVLTSRSNVTPATGEQKSRPGPPGMMATLRVSQETILALLTSKNVPLGESRVLGEKHILARGGTIGDTVGSLR